MLKQPTNAHKTSDEAESYRETSRVCQRSPFVVVFVQFYFSLYLSALTSYLTCSPVWGLDPEFQEFSMCTVHMKVQMKSHTHSNDQHRNHRSNFTVERDLIRRPLVPSVSALEHRGWCVRGAVFCLWYKNITSHCFNMKTLKSFWCDHNHVCVRGPNAAFLNLGFIGSSCKTLATC